jgi:hypothetical protein
MKSSEQINELAAAMAVAQAEVRNAVPNAENPHFRSSYADLEAVKAACLPFLNKYGISIVQSPVVQDGRIGVVTRLLHKSGQWMEGEFTMPGVKQDPQGYGSALTYARRYSLAAFAGVATGEDDDAEKAHEPKRGGSAANPTPPARPWMTSPPRPTALEDTVSEADMAIGVSPPQAGRLTVQKITDYRLHLAASRAYLRNHPPIEGLADLRGHRIVGYIPDMIFDKELHCRWQRKKWPSQKNFITHQPPIGV